MIRQLLVASVVTGIAAVAAGADDFAVRGIEALESFSDAIVHVTFNAREPGDGHHRLPARDVSGSLLTADDVVVIYHSDEEHHARTN